MEKCQGKKGARSCPFSEPEMLRKSADFVSKINIYMPYLCELVAEVNFIYFIIHTHRTCFDTPDKIELEKEMRRRKRDMKE